MRSVIKRVLLLIPLVLCSASAWSGVGRFLSFEGDVRVNDQQVTTDTQLNQDDTVVTGPDGVATIVLSDNSV
jgi:hypothetical protein